MLIQHKQKVNAQEEPYLKSTKNRDQTGWSDEQSVRLTFWEIKGFGLHTFEPWSSQCNYFKTDPFAS